MASSAPNPLLADYQRVCPRFNRQYAEDMARWADDPMLVSEMLYGFVFQDTLHFGICDEDVIAELVDAIENCR